MLFKKQAIDSSLATTYFCIGRYKSNQANVYLADLVKVCCVKEC